MAFDQKRFDEMIIKNSVVGIKLEPFKLKSGRLSHWYANCRILSDSYSLIDQTASFVVDFIKDKGIKCDYVYGVPAGATKLAVVINYKLGQHNPQQKIVIGREVPKDHGDPRDRYFIGPVKEGDKVAVLEDVTTTGGSLGTAIKSLIEAKLKVVAAIGLFNRLDKRDDGKSVEQYLKEEFNVPYYWLSDSSRILPIVAKSGKISKNILKKVEDEIRETGISPIKLV